MTKIFAVLLSLYLMTPALAEEPVPLQAAEIEVLLNGNTVKGTWDGKAYRQFFDANSVTIYQQDKAPESRGRWKVDAAKNAYCSEWNQSGVWACYEVLSQGDHYLWRSESGHTESFTVLAGKQL